MAWCTVQNQKWAETFPNNLTIYWLLHGQKKNIYSINIANDKYKQIWQNVNVHKHFSYYSIHLGV